MLDGEYHVYPKVSHNNLFINNHCSLFNFVIYDNLGLAKDNDAS